VTDLSKMGECTIWIDCDVLQADGGTRTASITAGYLALASAVEVLLERGSLRENPLREEVAAVSAGLVGEDALLDLCYSEDARAEVDFNVVMTGSGSLVELQGTAEGEPFSRQQLDRLVDMAASGIERLVQVQRAALAG
jgi:ribonuclease PH